MCKIIVYNYIYKYNKYTTETGTVFTQHNECSSRNNYYTHTHTHTHMDAIKEYMLHFGITKWFADSIMFSIMEWYPSWSDTYHIPWIVGSWGMYNEHTAICLQLKTK